MASKKISQLTSATPTGAELIEVSRLSAVAISVGTISAAAADNSYNDSGSGFVAAGFAAGDQVRVQGFTGNVANNIFSARITALTAAKMTIGGTDGDVIVNDAAGETVTITKWETRRVTAQEVGDLGGGGGGGGGVELKGLTFTSDTGSTADSDPGAGLFKWNNATQASATVLFFDNTTADAVSLATFYASLGTSGFIYLQQSDDATKWQLWKWSGLPVDGTGYRKFTVALQASGGSIVDNKTTYADFSSSAPAGIAMLADDQTFTGANRGTLTTDNDLSFDLTATNNFSCTPTGGGTLTFTNIASAAGQSGFIKLANTGGHTIAAAGTTKVGGTMLADISAAGTYLLSYFCDGSNVYVVASGALA